MSRAYLDPSGRFDLYADAIRRATPRLLGMMDRGPDSVTAGSFDRDHWAWKMRDCPIGMLQMGLVPLAKIAESPAGASVLTAVDRLPEWIALGIEETLRRQRPNGSFDSVGPFTQDHGMTLAAAWLLATVGHRMEGQISEDLVDRMRSAVRKACSFGLRSEEDYAFISNHQALFALGFHEAGRFSGDQELGSHADRLIHEIIQRQSADGWYQEYQGADPGYETLGLHYLAELLDERDPAGLRASLERSVGYLAHFVHSDGSLGGIYGSRNTHLWMPGGLERLASWLPLAEAIVGRVAHALPESPVVTLDSVDHHNLPPLLGAYVSAWQALEGADQASARPCADLPVNQAEYFRHFPDSGVTVVLRPGYHAVVAGRAGGIGVVYERTTGRRIFHDTGYLAEAGGRQWTSQAPGASQVVAHLSDGTARLEIDGRFEGTKQQVVTPWKHLLLRVLNLTVFRSVRLGAWVRGFIVRRMITGRVKGPIGLRRTITFEVDRVIYADDLQNDGGAAVSNLRHTSSFQAIHMGSARYFTGGERWAPTYGSLPTNAHMAPGASHSVALTVQVPPPDPA